MGRMSGMLASALLGTLFALGAAGAAAADTAATAHPPTSGAVVADQVDEPATLRILNREVLTMRARLAGLTPQARVQRARERIGALPDEAVDLPLNQIQFNLGEVHGVQFLLGDLPLFSVLEGDADIETKQGFDALVLQTRARLEEIRTAWRQARSKPLLLQGLLSTLVATLALGALIWIVYRVSAKAVEWMEKKRDVLAARFPYVDWREFLARLAVGILQIVQWVVLLAIGYFYVYYVLDSFVATEPIAKSLGNWLLGKVEWLAEGSLESLPGLVTVFIVLMLTRAAVDVLGYFFDALQKGRLRLPMVHSETVPATRRIFTLLTWALGVAIAYPFLPGSSSDVFKGLSVLFGLMVTLGSSGLVTQAMSGLVVVYSRSLHKGDFVDINGVQGVVTEVASLATKIVNVRNEEITIPNSVLIANPIHNYSKLAGSQGTLLTTRVTIGYDAPWRQVHELLLGAAKKTAGVRATPVPYVYQRALSDFYVEYELFVSIDNPLERVPILSVLHASIQDEFNAYGVQIMSPHFLGQPDRAVVVDKDQWYAAPARQP
ncbi:mechanosensitive ion channel domain-containing protein [Variovorax sp. J31P207]|uniref:mechanosensitive ion channel family protein n=1 Tax=Variovorax sp. J31P207 TaxID=3053510 RepID=UPI0025759244|nr:mechanosensitive ion channel domain-containing protein [Variovorax sp. J31P207]MDM0066363.1 mechanosensitive ion channel [Variovorax sp. J31P207]